MNTTTITNTTNDLCSNLQLEINKLNKIIEEQKQTITDLQQYLIPPKFKKGEIVRFYANDELYIIDDFVCYDTSYALYNIHNVNNKEDFETVTEIDLTSTDLF